MNLQNLRQEIDNIDKQLLKYLAKRMNISKQVWIHKKEKWIQPLQSLRRNEVLDNKKEKWKKLWLNEKFIENIRNSIHQESLRQQK